MAMRRILVNYAKMRGRQKRGNGVVPLSLDADLEVGANGGALDIVALDAALDTVPPEEVVLTGSEMTYTDLEPGRWVFHVRARDGAGNWGPPALLPFELTGP